jgi:hypothetical protein
MPGDDIGKKGKKEALRSAVAQAKQATADFKQAAQHAENVVQALGGAVQAKQAAQGVQGQAQAVAAQAAKAKAALEQQGLEPVSTREVTGSMANLEVEFPPQNPPPPAFAGVCVVHRFPEYVLIDFGSIDPLQVTNVPGGQKAVLQHVGRICLPEQTAKRLFLDLANHFGSTG